MTTLVLCNDITITNLKSPLLPFHLGKARVVESKHTFIHYINLSPISNQLKNIEKFYDIIEISLNKSSSKNNNPLLRYLHLHAKHLISNAKNKLNNITPHKREKRGLLNIVGKAHKWLFGTLDSDDGEKFENAISVLQNNQDSLYHEISLRVSLTQELINNYNKTITLLSFNQHLITRRIEYFSYYINKTIDDISAYLRAQNTLDQIILNCQNLITFLDNLENALMFAKLNTLHSTVISVSELDNIVNYLFKLYNNETMISFKNTISYYQLCGIQVGFSNDRIIFAIHFPILKNEVFDNFHLIPIPINQSIIIPNYPYLILGSDQLQESYEDCPSIEEVHICQNRLKPLFGDCIVSMIRDAENRNCRTVSVHLSKPIFKAVTSKHIVMIPAEKSLKIMTKCQSNENYVFIEQPSLIELPTNCEIKALEFQFFNTEELVKENPLHLPEITIHEDNAARLDQSPINLRSIDMDEIHQLQEKSQLQKMPKKYEIHPIGWSFISIAATLALVATTCFVLVKVYIRKLRKPEANQSNQSNQTNQS